MVSSIIIENGEKLDSKITIEMTSALNPSNDNVH